MSKWIVKDKAGHTYEVLAETWDDVGCASENELRFYDGTSELVAVFVEPICWMQKDKAEAQ